MTRWECWARPRPAAVTKVAAAVAGLFLLGCSPLYDADVDEGAPLVPTPIGAGGAGTGGQAVGGQAAGGQAVGGQAVGGSGTGAGPVGCEWPAGPYGEAEGQFLSQYKQWQGFREHSDQVETIPITDYYDCDGSKGINAVMFTTVQWLCGACQEEAAGLAAEMAGWESMGIKVGVMLVTGPSDGPATTTDAMNWRNNFNLHAMAVVADPTYSLVPGNSVGTPQMTIVNPRTMEVHYLQEGYSGYYSELEWLAMFNSNQ